LLVRSFYESETTEQRYSGIPTALALGGCHSQELYNKCGTRAMNDNVQDYLIEYFKNQGLPLIGNKSI